jgi:hypothetical protein
MDDRYHRRETGRKALDRTLVRRRRVRVDGAARFAYAALMRIPAALALACLLALAASTAAAKDLVLRQKTTVAGVGARSVESTQYWTPRRMIVDEAAGRIVVDFVDENLTSIDKTRKTWIVLTFEQMSRQMDAARLEMAQRTQDLDADAKAQLERMGEAIGDRDSAVEVKPTGKREKIAGYDAEEYTFSGSAVKGTLWISKDLPLPLGEKEMKAYRRSTYGMKGPGRQFALAMAQVKALPLRTVMQLDLGPDGTTSTNEVIEVRAESPPAAMIDVPEGFTEMKPGAAPTPTS